MVGDRPLETAKRVRDSVRAWGRRPAEYLVEKYQSDKHFRRVANVAVLSNALYGTALAQVDAADGLVCGTGLGLVFGLGLGILMLYLLGDAAFQGTLAWKNMGKSQSGSKQDGREQLKSGGLSFVGAFVPGVFGVLLDRLGIGAFSCVDWQGLLGAATGGSAAVIPAATSAVSALPF